MRTIGFTRHQQTFLQLTSFMTYLFNSCCAELCPLPHTVPPAPHLSPTSLQLAQTPPLIGSATLSPAHRG